MVEHTSAAQTTQSGSSERQRWQLRQPEVTSGHHHQQQHHHHHHRFSLFRWFRRRDSTSSADGRRRHLFRKAKRRASTSSSSSSSTFYSTATVRSFAFHSGRIQREDGGDVALTAQQRGGVVGPFAPGAAKLVEKRRYSRNDEPRDRLNAAVTCTLPSAFSQRQDIQTRYSLLPANSPFISYDSIPVVERRPRAFAQVRRGGEVKAASVTSDISVAGVKRVHVKGKRRAPDPPVQRSPAHAEGSGVRPARGRRKRRPAPKPPGYTETLSSNQDTLSSGTSTGMDSLLAVKDCQTISNDTLVLRRGVLLSKKDVNSSPTSRSQSRTPTISVCDSDGDVVLLNGQASGSKTNTIQSSIMPRPWYKRNANDHHSGSGARDSSTNTRRGGDFLRGLSSSIPAETKDENAFSTTSSTSSTLTSSFPFEGSLSRLGFFHRGDRFHHHDDKKKENKRKSGVSILTNISELDKEAAAIVQEEQARNRASMILQTAKMDEEFDRRMGANEDIVQEIVNSSMESSPRRSTRALISKFNALGNITKVTVNSGFFAKNNSASPKAKTKRYSQGGGNERRDNFADERLERDLSRYFLPHQSSPKRESSSIFTEVVLQPTKTKTSTVAAAKPTVAAAAAASSASSPKAGKSDNAEFAKSLAAELDDVATGIAKLRRELDNRPSRINNATADKEQTPEAKKDATPPAATKRSPSRDKELAKFDKEFTKIFDEIDRQLRTNSRQPAAKPAEPPKVTEASISNQVAKVIDILVNAEKDAAAAAAAAAVLKTPPEEARNKEPKAIRQTVRISGVDDKTTADLKEMLKEMKHSLPKRPAAAAAAAAAARGSKVSSGVQTSGNVRKIERAGPKNGEITYANVIGSAAMAEARLEDKPREAKEVKIDLRPATDAATASPLLPREDGGAGEANKRSDNEEGEKLDEIKKQYMNTLAVNRLLRKLEAAIASGHHQQAAGLAKELAQLKIHCSVVRQRSCGAKEKLNLNMYIEDKQAHQGPIPLQLPANMTVAQLKAKIHIEFEIPANVQRWIIGKNLADNDESTLEELQAVEGSPVFLYLVAPPDLQDKEAIKADKQEVDAEAGEERAEQVINEKNDEQIHEIKAEIEPEAREAEAEPQAREERTESLSKEEKLKRYEELMSLENCDVISSTEPIECPVCFMITAPGEGVILRDCLHSFCRVCVANTVRYCEEAEVKCPYRDADYTCESTLQEREIKALVAAEVYQQHLAKSIAQAENNAGNNAFHCKTPDCPGWCIYDDNVNNFLCPVCKANNCLTCQAIHMGKNCRQYQEELKYSKESDHESKRTAAMLEEMVERGEALPCPTCAVVLMKKWGCDWLRCSMCKTEICWVTRGPRWGPGGKGDTSGGCKCGENGVKCHPRCNYCH